MPIYAYRCTTCGHAKDVLQKLADPMLTECPACGAATFVKQVTAAGFQLKGSGWYVTDFRDGKKGDAPKAGDAAKPAEAGAAAAPAAAGAPPVAAAAPAAATPAPATAAPPPAPSSSGSGSSGG